MNRRRLGLLAFLLVSFGAAWLLALPLWLGAGLMEPMAPLIAVALMFTPTLGTFAALLIERPARPFANIGLWPIGRPGRFIGFLALAILVPAALALIALPVGALLGVFPADFAHFSGFEALLQSQAYLAELEMPAIPIALLVLAQISIIPLGAVLNLPPSLGEEIGWRGYLFPRLQDRWGTTPAILLSGLIWGLWHAPLILLGYNYPNASGPLALLLMVGMCTVFGAVFSWLRARSGSVWPAAIAHGTFNATASMPLLFVALGGRIDTVHATALGWSGWIVPAVVVVILVVTKRFTPVVLPAPRPRPQAGRRPQRPLR